MKFLVKAFKSQESKQDRQTGHNADATKHVTPPYSKVIIM